MRVVVSGCNFTSGGPLSVIRDLLLALAARSDLEVIALVHSTELFPEEIYRKIRFICFPDSKQSWAKRLRYEYLDFHRLSKELDADIWLSMHDITPNVRARFLATYCHNPSPFYNLSWKDILYDKKFSLFCLFYKYLYRINIHKNDAVFVQQNWIRDAFQLMYNHKHIVVARPNIHLPAIPAPEKADKNKVIFLYPAFPRTFKNFEVICEAAKELEARGITNFTVRLTIDGGENGYAAEIVRRFSSVRAIDFVGLQSRDQVFQFYQEADVLVFPSKLETWGLPISEFQMFGKPILAADLPYARETVGEYRAVDFFAPGDSRVLAQLMERQIRGGDITYSGNAGVPAIGLTGWEEFINFVVKEYSMKEDNAIHECSV